MLRFKTTFSKKNLVFFSYSSLMCPTRWVPILALIILLLYLFKRYKKPLRRFFSTCLTKIISWKNIVVAYWRRKK